MTPLLCFQEKTKDIKEWKQEWCWSVFFLDKVTLGLSGEWESSCGSAVRDDISDWSSSTNKN